MVKEEERQELEGKGEEKLKGKDEELEGMEEKRGEKEMEKKVEDGGGGRW